ncbi:MAG: nitroreductase family deazaflavin-dependent oxidoreductase [Chloroflexota bacterium]|nr:nitroreductase family deazaflavin-dependent oxidoreductase [Chloroflexota bacterium]
MTIERFIPYPHGTARNVMRLPLWGYRVGLGNLLDMLGVMILTTRGHQSGQPRHTPITYQVHGSKVYMVSGWGDRPSWYRNLIAQPDVTVQRGSTVYAGRAYPVTNSGEALRVLHLFRRRAPGIYDALIARLSDRESIDASTLHQVTDRFTIVRVEPVPGAATLPAVPVDTRWMPPAALFAVALVIALIVSGRRRA